MTNLINFLLYQIGWFACVLGAAWAHQWLGIGIAGCMVALHLWLATDRSIQVKLIFVAALVGLLVDCLLLRAGCIEFPQGSLTDWLPPPFMTLLWIQFATTFRYCMSWLSGRYSLAACFGLMGAPLAFYAGEKLGAIVFLAPRIANFTRLGIHWAIVVPVLVYAADQLARHSSELPRYRGLK